MYRYSVRCKVTNQILNSWLSSYADETLKDPSFPAAYDILREDLSLEEAKTAARLHLNNTDWAVIRQVDIGTPIPQEVKDSRAAARAVLNDVTPPEIIVIPGPDIVVPPEPESPPEVVSEG